MGKRKQANPVKNAALKQSTNSTTDNDAGVVPQKPFQSTTTTAAADLAAEHLPPMTLVFTVMVFSGALFVLGLRDALATGKPIAGPFDEAMLQFTDSTVFFEDSLGWKSKQGGLSAIESVTTDDNNMGGLFVRKMAGAAAATVHLQKLLPLLFHPQDDGAQWNAGHFHPLYWMSVFGNFAIAAFYASYWSDLKASQAEGLPLVIVGMLGLESLVLVFHLLTTRTQSRKAPAVAMPDGKTPTSVASRIVTRTVMAVSLTMSVLMARDLFFPGYIFDFIPRDDIYLEWTNAFLHSPPEGSPEEEDQGLEAALFVGDKFVSQFMALHMLLLIAYKFLTAFGIPYGNDGSGEIKCRMIWKAQCLGDGFVLFLLRLFSAAALSASLDLRWHLMLVAYETFILFLYAWF